MSSLLNLPTLRTRAELYFQFQRAHLNRIDRVGIARMVLYRQYKAAWKDVVQSVFL